VFDSMDLKSLNEAQREALLDLLILGMYSDGHLAAAEDTQLRQLLGKMGLDSEYDRDRALDASATRVRKIATTSEAARGHADSLVQVFAARDQRRLVYDALNEFLASDEQITAPERNFAAMVCETLRL